MNETVVFLIVMACLLLLFLFAPRKQKTRAFCVGAVVLVLLFEIFVANFHSFHLLGGGYEKTVVDLQGKNVKTEGFRPDTLQSYLDGKETKIRIKDVNRPVGTVTVLLDMPESTEDNIGTSSVYVQIDATDDSHAAYERIGVADGEVIRGNERSQTLVLDLTGSVGDLNLRLHADRDHGFTVKGIIFNQPVPFRFSLVRSLLMLGGMLGLYALLTFPSMRAPFEEKKRLFTGLTMCITVVLVGIAAAMILLYQYDSYRILLSNFADERGNQITKELVDAFKAKQVFLTDPVPEELLELKNPYDWSERLDEDIAYKWDHLLFEGKYYSYYGIAPVLLLFLPYNLITGLYFPTPEAVFLFGALGVLFLSLLYLEFAKRFCHKVPLNMLISGLIVIQLSCGVWYNFCSPLFYEIAQTSGFCFTCAGFFFLLRSRVIGEGKIRYPSLFFSGMCLALAVLCRPTLALYCIVALFFIGFGFFKLRNHLHLATEKEKKSRVRVYVGYFVCALICYVFFGGVQMAYNWARFGSVLDFGIQYSLTINDFTRAQYHTDFVMIGLYNYLLTFPQINPNFPYVFSNLSELSVNGYYFVATNSAAGLIWRALPTFGYFGTGGAWKTLSKSEKKQFLLIGIPLCVLAPLIIMFSIWESGYAARYASDFAWQIMLGGIGILYLIHNRVARDQTKTVLEYFFVFSALIAIVTNFGLIYGFMSRGGHLAAGYHTFERLFDFWM